MHGRKFQNFELYWDITWVNFLRPFDFQNHLSPSNMQYIFREV